MTDIKWRCPAEVTDEALSRYEHVIILVENKDMSYETLLVFDHKGRPYVDGCLSDFTFSPFNPFKYRLLAFVAANEKEKKDEDIPETPAFK